MSLKLMTDAALELSLVIGLEQFFDKPSKN